MGRKLLILLGFIGLAGCATTENKYLGCNITQEEDGQFIACYDQTIFVPNHDYISELVDPCGDGPGPDEILIVFNNGTHVAWYKDLGLVTLDPYIVYRTTDAQKCKFKLTNNGIIDETMGEFYD